jgi:hypothetical protein
MNMRISGLLSIVAGFAVFLVSGSAFAQTLYINDQYGSDVAFSGTGFTPSHSIWVGNWNGSEWIVDARRIPWMRGASMALVPAYWMRDSL